MTILKTIPRVINPRLLYTLARMGHGDEIVFADANFPASSVAKHTTLGEEIRMDGTTIPEILQAVLQLLPLDENAPPAYVMAVMEEHKKQGVTTPVWDTYRTILKEGEGRTIELEEIERFAFYERAKTAFAVVSTGETALYGNIILKKGIIAPSKE